MGMRLAMFTDSFHPELGGIQDSILFNVRELSARGHEVLVVAPAAARRDYVRVNLPVMDVDLGKTVQVYRLPSVPAPSSSQQSRLAIPNGRCWRRVADFDPEVIHSHTFFGIGLEALRTARRLGRPLVGTNHWLVSAFDSYVPAPVRRAYRHLSGRLVARYYQKCDWVTAPSGYALAQMQRLGLRPPSSIISNPIDTSVFRPAAAGERCTLKSRLKLGDAVVVSAGRLGREKHVDVIIRAVAAARECIPHISLVVAGHGSEQTSLQRLACELGLGERVRFVGTLNHAALSELFAAAEVFAIGSTSETQSMVLLQAMACGLPAVAARSGALIEYVDSEAGLLADPNSPVDFARKIVAAMVKSEPLESMRQAATKLAQAFRVESIATKWENLYTQLRLCRRGRIRHPGSRSADLTRHGT